jgi:hypothetical protein
MTFPSEKPESPTAEGGQGQPAPYHSYGYVPSPQQAYGPPSTPRTHYAQPVPQADYRQPQPPPYHAYGSPAPMHYATQGPGYPAPPGIHTHGFPVARHAGSAQAPKRWPWIVGGLAAVAFLAVAGLVVLSITAKVGYEHATAGRDGDDLAKSDVRGAVSAVEQYYTDNGNSYPGSALVGDNGYGGMPQVELGPGAGISLSEKTRLYYVPIPGQASYKICATNTGGSGKWYLYDSSQGGSVKEVSPPVNPAACE